MLSNAKIEEVKQKSFGREVFETLLIVAVIFLLFQFVFMSVKVNGTSMEPTYVDGERGVMMRSQFYNVPKQHDVVVVNFHNPDTDEEELIVKRVFGTPNDTVEIKDNKVIVNGKVVNDDKRSPDTLMDDMDPIKLADDEYFILGDNRQVSLDSRYIGPVHKKDIRAVNGISYWPLDKIGLIN